MIDIQNFSINGDEDGNNYALVASSTANETIFNFTWVCPNCNWNTFTNWYRNWCSFKKEIPLGPNIWNVELNSELKITIKPSNAAVTEGTWKCKHITSDDHDGEWENALVYENRNGYLTHEIKYSPNCKEIVTYNIKCRKTSGTLKMQSLFHCILVQKWFLCRIVFVA